jgi:hypothetical protein
MSSWSLFLHQLGRFVGSSKPKDGTRPSVVISTPCLDFASVLVSSGIVAGRFEDRSSVVPDLEQWREAKGSAVCFPRIKNIDGDDALYLSKGLIDEIDSFNGKKRLLVKWVENSGQRFSRAVENRWLPLITPIDDSPPIQRKKPGSVLARNVKSLESILGESGICELVGKSHDCICLVDTKNRVMDEVKERVPLAKLGMGTANMDFVFRDLVRLDSEGGEAMSGTYCCSVLSEPEKGWPVTVFTGSLRFLRHWNDSDSPVRVAILSPIETNYMDAVAFANELYLQRADAELHLPDEILSVKPASIDIQVMYSH